jgi:hypothetical protein
VNTKFIQKGSLKKVERIIYFFNIIPNGEEQASKFTTKINTIAVKVFEHRIDHDLLNEYYYYKDIFTNHHFVLITGNFYPYEEIIIHEDITPDELVDECNKLHVSTTHLKDIINAMLKIPELQHIAAEIMLMGRDAL